jgi:thimet oligopeptidase
MKEHMRVDETKIQEYFPLEATVAALFSIYESFFGIKFTKHAKLGGAFWHESVEVLEVHKDGALLGYVVLDLFPREGKYSHACCHGVVPAVALTPEAGSTYSPALAVVIANFPTATSDRPALFLHSDVETFFHEFGHAIHGLFGRTPMATVAGTNVKRDFVELPSQMLENWVWQPAILKQISQHFQSKQPLPEELIAAKVASKSTFNGRDYLRQLQFARYSLEIFGAEFAAQAEEKLDTTALMDRIRHEVLPHIAHPQNSHFQCAFGHLTGYGAGYYGYMWSEVFSADVFATINKVPGGLLSPEMGERYTRHIIGPGGSRDPAEMIEAFLGRAPNSDAFMEDLGIKN